MSRDPMDNIARHILKVATSEGARVKDSARAPAPPKPASPKEGARVVSPGDERGVSYPGDFDNPLDGSYRGCF